MNNVNDFLAKLDKAVWTEDVKRDEVIRGVLMGKDVEVSLQTKINNTRGNRVTPIHLVMYVRIGGVMAGHWGCMDIEEQLIMTEWFILRGVMASDYEFDKRIKNEREAKAFFEML
tara:strand:- start:1300 stop:1644 length:345 start_codon:yes stop_codon:yes gene_type:complete